MVADDLYNRLAELSGDIELAIAKILMRNPAIKNETALRLDTDDNNVRCVFYENTPIRTLTVEQNLNFLEDLEKKLDFLKD